MSRPANRILNKIRQLERAGQKSCPAVPQFVPQDVPVSGAPGAVDPALAARWIADVQAPQREQRWNPSLVRDRLNEAMQTLRMMDAGSIAPKGARSGMPDVLRAPLSLRELIDQLYDPMLHAVAADRRMWIGALSAQISRAEEALEWPFLHLAEHEGPRRVLNVWMRSRALRNARFNAMCRERGWPLSTAKDALDRACRIIADALNRHRVPVR